MNRTLGHRVSSVWFFSGLVVSGLMTATGAQTARPYTLDGPPTSLTGTHLIGLPAQTFAPTVISTCGDLRTIVNAGGTGVNAVISVIDTNTGLFVTCADPDAIQVGSAYQVQVQATSSFTIFGDDQTLVLPLSQTTSGTGRNYIALPFGTSLLNAKNLIDSIGLAQTQRVEKYKTTTDTYDFYTGRVGTSGQVNFPVTGGSGYRVRMNTTVYWTPPGPSGGCLGFGNKTFPSGSDATALRDQFVTDFAASISAADYTCTASGPTGAIVLNVNVSSPCYGSSIFLNFVVPPGGTTTTTQNHPYGYEVCCNSPLSSLMGMDGGWLVRLDSSTHSFGEISVSSTQTSPGGGSAVPALSTVYALVLSGALLAFVVWYRMRPVA